MASDIEDLELESLRSAVLASLKPKPAQNEVTSAGASSDSQATAAEEEDEEESLRLLRLAALKSKKEDSISHVSTPVTGSPVRPPHHPIQGIPQHLQSAPFHEAGPAGRSNLITIPLQDTPVPLLPAPSINSHQAPVRRTGAEDSGSKEERSAKFSRFESSDSESDSDEDLLLQTASDSEKSAFSASGSDKEEDSDAESWRTRSFSEAESSASEAEENDKKSPEDVDNESNDKSKNAEKDAKGQKGDRKRFLEREDTKSEHVIRKDDSREIRDSNRKNHKDREVRHSDLRSRLGNKERERRKDRDHRFTRDKRDAYRSRDSEREKGIEEKRRRFEAQRGEKRHSRERSQRHMSDRSRRADRTNDNIDKRAFEARRQKFASGSSVNLKDKKVTLTFLKSSENGGQIPVNKSSAHNIDLDKKESKTIVEREKLPTEEIESDISLSSEESEAKSEADSDTEDEDKKESESESESGSDEEVTRFKRISTKSDAKISSQAPMQSRLITSMTFPKEGPPALLPRRRLIDIDRSRDRKGLDDLERSRRPPGFRDQGRERPRWDHVPRHLDQQERSTRRESRDRLRLDPRELRRHPRDVNEKLDIKDYDKLRNPRSSDMNERGCDSKTNSRDMETNERVPHAEHAPHRNPRVSNFDEKRDRMVARDDDRTVNDRIPHTERAPRRSLREGNIGDDKRTLSRKIPSAQDFVSESSDSESETVKQALRSIVKTDKPEENSKISFRDKERLHRSKDIDRDELKQRKDTNRDRGAKEKKSKHKRDVKDRIGRRKRGVVDLERISDDDAAKIDSFIVTISEDPAAQKKRSVLDRLGSAPPANKVRNSVKLRLGPVKTEAADSTTDIAPVNPEEESFPDENLGPHGDSVKRRKVEINDTHSNPTKKRLKLKRVERSEVKYDELEVDTVSDMYMYTVAEPPVKHKQLSKSLLSRLSDKPSTPLDSEDASTPLEGGSSPDVEPVERKVKSRDADDRVEKKSKSKSRDVWTSRRKTDVVEKEEDADDILSKQDVRKSKNKDIWTSKRSVITAEQEGDGHEDISLKKECRARDGWSSKRKAVTMEMENDSKSSKDDELEERIRMIKAKNAAIIQRQREIEEEKKMFGGQR